MPPTTRPDAARRAGLPKPLAVAAAVVVLPVLMAFLAIALTMLTRMLVEREQDPAVHWPTFWVWFVLCTGGVAVPMIVAEIRRDRDPTHPATPDGSGLTLTVQEEPTGPVTRVTLESPDTAPVFTLVRAHELSPADVGLMQQLTTGVSGLGVSRGDTHALNEAGLSLVAASTGTFRDVLTELIWRARRELPDDQEDLSDPPSPGGPRHDDISGTGGTHHVDPPSPGGPRHDDISGTGGTHHVDPPSPGGPRHAPDGPAPARTEQVDVFHDPHIAVPRGPLHRRVQVLTWVLIGLYAVTVVAMLVWRGVSEAGTGPDIDDQAWAMNVGLSTTLVGPFVIWGAFGLQNYVRAHEARHSTRRIAARARADFWFFGFCSALVMVFLGLLTVAGVWVGTEGLGPTLITVAVTGAFVGVARWCQLRWRSWSSIPGP
ncbi:hypothetical protein MWU75_06860 [Ornithinimicrobium sp. F0845]|uniref:hypothetical protein n=1 Tax=Ornithinimicrobium sp. F0845 TaxID=2926412 RepID=UPI001FF6CCC3|nr:hypothetical protein [Ornithinimicrobium sp. F0845]MCK0111856.1 hypothetical protein [Ornithinimicrobium sp. F0845]